jgi:nitroimidazol reductase NimA-like FMN-containing flavoprotein (pyridoxamine 5'-phosphate oxidase superfamily)
MAREHATIKMTPEELRAYLAADSRLVVATLDADDAPWADGAAYTFVDDRVYFRIPTDSKTYANIQRDDRVCCVVESKPTISSYYDIKGALLHGHAEALSEGDDGIASTLEAMPDPVEPGRAGDWVILSVGLDDSTSFSFDKIQGRYQDRQLAQ